MAIRSGLPTVLTVVLLAAGPNAARGALSSIDDPVFGPGALTRDTESNLDWLDITLTSDRSFEQISGQFGAGGEFAGFRHATVAEVRTLFEHAAIPVIAMPDDSSRCPATSVSNIAPALALMELVGSNSSQDGHPEAIAVTGDPFPHPDARLRGDIDFAIADGTPTYSVSVGCTASGDTIPVSHWLVRSSVIPEPASAVLLALGLAGLSRRRP